MKEKRQADRTFEERSISLSTDHLGSACKKHHFVATEQNTAVCLCHFHIPPRTTRIRNVSRSHASETFQDRTHCMSGTRLSLQRTCLETRTPTMLLETSMINELELRNAIFSNCHHVEPPIKHSYKEECSRWPNIPSPLYSTLVLMLVQLMVY